MATIGVIDIAIRASSEKFVKGLADSSKALTSFVKSAVSRLPELTLGLAKLGLAAGAVAFGGFAALTASAMPAIDATAKLADRIGTTTEALAGLQFAAGLGGGPVEQLPEIMGKLSASLGKASGEATPAGLALKQLGLDAKTLANLDSIDALGQIADGINGLGSASDRSSALVAIFGEQGVKLANTLAGGSKGLRDAAAEAGALGNAVSRVDAAKVELANDAMTKIGKVISGIGTQLAVQLAPFIDAAGTKFADLAKSGGGVGPIVARGVKFAAVAVGYLADAAHFAKIAFLGLKPAATFAVSTVVKAFALGQKAVAAFLNLFPGAKVEWGATADAIAGDLDKLIASQLGDLETAWGEALPSAKVGTFFDALTSGADKSAQAIADAAKATRGLGDDFAATAFKVGELESKLTEQLDTLGMTSAQVEIYKLKQAGATDADLARVESLSMQIDQAELGRKAFEKLTQEADKLTEDARKPFEKIADEFDNLTDIFQKGLIDPETFRRSVAKLGDGSDVGTASKGAGALELGSAEARSAILAFRSDGNRSVEDAQRRTATNTEIAAKLARDTAANTAQLVSMFKDMNGESI